MKFSSFLGLILLALVGYFLLTDPAVSKTGARLSLILESHKNTHIHSLSEDEKQIFATSEFEGVVYFTAYSRDSHQMKPKQLWRNEYVNIIDRESARSLAEKKLTVDPIATPSLYYFDQEKDGKQGLYWVFKSGSQKVYVKFNGDDVKVE